VNSKRRQHDKRNDKRTTSWEPLAEWYAGWVGKNGSEHHRRLALPAVLELLQLRPGERLLDLGCGPAVLAPHVAEAGCHYTGVDLSERMVGYARKHHGRHGRFLVGDVSELHTLPGLRAAAFDAVVFLLSVQDMEPLHQVLEAAAWALRGGGRAVLLLTHPCFRVPRQSGWGWDEGRKLRYRRVDRYLTPLPVPLKPHPGGGGVSWSFHRPLSAYINGLAAVGLLLEQMEELVTYKQTQGSGAQARAEHAANQEFPLFLALRAVKVHD
jgi:SAM-dependent methyltransferase